MRGSNKEQAIGHRLAQSTKAVLREIEAVQTRATLQQTEEVRVSALVPARVRTVAAPETVLVTGRFQKPTHLGIPARSADHRTEPLLKPAVHEARPAWEVRVLAEARVRVAAAARGNRFVKKKENIMNTTKINALLTKILFTNSGIAACGLLAIVLCVGPQATAATTDTPPVQQKTFDTAQQAADAMILAVKNDDVPALLEIFGPAGKDFVSTGDDVQDKNSRAEFAALAQEKMSVEIVPQHPNTAILSVGNEEWPTPVPIVKVAGKWHFDSQAGRTAILDRRIGGNELDAITICRGYAEAQEVYASEIHDDSGVNQYAQRIISTPGKHDGLAWRNPDGTEGGPIAEAVAKAIEEGYTSKSGPYHGYYFKTLMGQGPAAPLGQLDYVVGGAMIGGFALVAWPAEYRVSGVETFIVSYDGIVYQKDLGPDTAKIASAMERYNPEKTWHRTSDAE
jgi:hypothetical protein